MKGSLRFVIAWGVFAILGCAGVRYQVVAPSARYPISLSPTLPDSTGTIRYPGTDLDTVATFSADYTPVAMFYSALSFLDVDLSDAVNRQVQGSQGQGVASLEVTTKACATNYFFPLTILPFWPGCQRVYVTGRIVRLKAMGNVSPVAEVGP